MRHTQFEDIEKENQKKFDNIYSKKQKEVNQENIFPNKSNNDFYNQKYLYIIIILFFSLLMIIRSTAFSNASEISDISYFKILFYIIITSVVIYFAVSTNISIKSLINKKFNISVNPLLIYKTTTITILIIFLYLVLH